MAKLVSLSHHVFTSWCDLASNKSKQCADSSYRLGLNALWTRNQNFIENFENAFCEIHTQILMWLAHTANIFAVLYSKMYSRCTFCSNHQHGAKGCNMTILHLICLTYHNFFDVKNLKHEEKLLHDFAHTENFLHKKIV